MQRPLDHVIFRTTAVQVGAFSCATYDPRFRDSGPTENHLVVFPRSAVWIRHAGSRAFVADPRLATIYNRGQEYTRTSLSPDGDRCDWFAVAPEVALDIARSLDQRVDDDPTRPFRHQFSACSSELYLRQRHLFLALRAGRVDPLVAEQRVMEIVDTSLREAYRDSPSRPERPRRSEDAQRDLVERARAAIAQRPTEKLTVAELARRLGTSPFHLCRVFRARTGLTLHAYRIEVRLRLLLEQLTTSSADLSRIAVELGFSSHSHMTALLRRRMGWTPRALRDFLTAESRGQRATWASADSAATSATNVARVRASPGLTAF
jgi:AraC family transcriptional regulator